jgi:hypothetical protein
MGSERVVDRSALVSEVYVGGVQVGWAQHVYDRPQSWHDRHICARRVGWEYVVAGEYVATNFGPVAGRHSDQLYRTRREAVAALVEVVADSQSMSTARSDA